MAEYYCLVAGLSEYSFADKQLKIPLVELREEIIDQMSAEDRRSLRLLYTYYDIQNIVNILQNSSLPFSQLGNLTRNQIEAEIKADEIDEEPFQSMLPSNIRLILDRHIGKVTLDEEEPITKEEVERRLYESFYSACEQSKCTFIREWCRTDRIIRNIITTHRAAELGIDAEEMVIGQTVDEKEFAYYSELMTVIDTKDFIERESKMDALRWQIAEELSEHNYFDVAAVLAYLVKVNILYRWSSLDKAVGEDRFRQIVKNFTDQTKLE